MSKTALAIAAALLAGTTLTSAANADAVRVGFGFPLGSFVAHSNESYSAPSRRNAEYTPPRRTYVPQQPVRQVKAAPVYAAAPATPAPSTVKTAKLEDKLAGAAEATTKPDNAASDSKTTTTVAKTSEASATDTVAAVTDVKTDDAGKSVCRRYSPAVGGLVDVPCDQ